MKSFLPKWSFEKRSLAGAAASGLTTTPAMATEMPVSTALSRNSMTDQLDMKNW
jgi:hypothetical protein